MNFYVVWHDSDSIYRGLVSINQFSENVFLFDVAGASYRIVGVVEV